MNKIYYFLTICLFFFACSKEDSLTPTGARDDYFTVPADATDPESVLRRNFYEEHGVHLLFNDTLIHEQRGTYADGTTYWHTEKIDLSYGLISTSGTYRHTLLSSPTEREEAVRFAEQYILPRLGEKVKPYSMLALKNLENYSRGDWNNVYFINGYRCLGFNFGYLAGLPEEEKEEAIMAWLKAAVSDKVEQLSSELNAFYAFSNAYYNEDYDDVNPDWRDEYESAADFYHSHGFIRSGSYYFYMKSTDLSDYVNALFRYTEEEFIAEYADYTIMHEKFRIFRKLILDMGYVL